MKRTNRREQRAALEATHTVTRAAPVRGASLAEIAEYYPAVRVIVTECARAMMERDQLAAKDGDTYREMLGLREEAAQLRFAVKALEAENARLLAEWP